MTAIVYRTGDATRPEGEGHKIIAHVCNTSGGWGKGFVLAVSSRWSEPEEAYRNWMRYKNHQKDPRVRQDPTNMPRTNGPFALGSVQVVPVASNPDVYVLNMLAQVGYGSDNRRPHKSDEPNHTIPLRYEALDRCLEAAQIVAFRFHASIHMPRIGCALAGGSWSQVETLIEKRLTQKGVNVFVYDYPGGTFNP